MKSMSIGDDSADFRKAKGASLIRDLLSGVPFVYTTMGPCAHQLRWMEL